MPENNELMFQRVTEHEIKINVISKDVEDVEKVMKEMKSELLAEIGLLRKDVRDVRKDFSEDKSQRQKNRFYISMAVLAGCFTVLASIITSVATIVH